VNHQERRFSIAWLVPLAVLLVVGWIVFDVYRTRGVEVSVSFPDGHGLGPGDTVRCRGIEVGAVRSVKLVESGVEVNLELDHANAIQIARSGSRWWVSRPTLDWSRVSGLDSLVGPRFIQVDPPSDGGDKEMFLFQGLTEAPIVDRIAPGDLSLTLVADFRGTLQPGASVFYRGVSVGTILSTALADDSLGVVARILIEGRYVPLVRTNSRFYQTGAFDLDIGLTGLSARLDSLETLFVGGVSLVTPTRPGSQVEPDHQFKVESELDDDYLEWNPAIDLVPAG
jgi:paraquat-inducible protein B